MPNTNSFPRSTERGLIEGRRSPALSGAEGSNFPRSTERGLIEGHATDRGAGRGLAFRVQPNAASLKVVDQYQRAIGVDRFPRSTERGLIEGLILTACARAAFTFRVQPNAASLKDR